jgi:hypothetical protein
MRREVMRMAVATVPVSMLPKGTAFARFVMALGKSPRSIMGAKAIAERWRDTPQVSATLDAWTTKALVPPGATTDASWAAPISQFGIGAEALTILRGLSILGQVEPKFVRVPLHTRVAHETGGGITGGWVGQNAPVPVQTTAFESILQELFKFGVIVPLAQELMEFSNPGAEEMVTRTALGGLAKSLDTQLLLPSVTAVAGVNPASITAGATAITSSGSTAAAIANDLNLMVAAITTPGQNLIWTMRRRTAATIAGALGATSGLPATLYGIPVALGDGSPPQVTLVDGSGVIYSDAGGFDLDVSDETSVQLDTVPANPATAATVFTSAWQTNTVFLKMMRWVSWLRVEAGAVCYMTVAY